MRGVSGGDLRRGCHGELYILSSQLELSCRIYHLHCERWVLHERRCGGPVSGELVVGGGGDQLYG